MSIYVKYAEMEYSGMLTSSNRISQIAKLIGMRMLEIGIGIGIGITVAILIPIRLGASAKPISNG